MNHELIDSDESMEQNLNENDNETDESISDKENDAPLNGYQRNRNI